MMQVEINLCKLMFMCDIKEYQKNSKVTHSKTTKCAAEKKIVIHKL